MASFQDLISQWDTSDYFNVLTTFDRQITEGKKVLTQTLDRPEYISLKAHSGIFRHILLCGMGGSAIAGDFVKTLFNQRLSIPFTVIRDYTVPEFVGKETLVIASSYSGTTEETLSALTDARQRKAHIVTISSGGKMADIARQSGYLHIPLPTGYQPRQTIGFSYTIFFGFLQHLFFDQIPETELTEGQQYLQSVSPLFSAENHFLFSLAKKIVHQPVVIYSSETFQAAAMRLKGQINENAKMPAFAQPVTEMCHNEIVGWQTLNPDPTSNFSVILLRDIADHPQIVKRFQILEEILGRKMQIVSLWSEGQSLFTRLLSLIYAGDWLSYYMALLRQQDPTPVDIITELKKRLTNQS